MLGALKAAIDFATKGDFVIEDRRRHDLHAVVKRAERRKAQRCFTVP
jgi:hypothetical protein